MRVTVLLNFFDELRREMPAGKWICSVLRLLTPARLRDTRYLVKSVEGIYRNGKVDLVEPLDQAEGSRVVVSWVSPPSVDLQARGIDAYQAADFRRRLAAPKTGTSRK